MNVNRTSRISCLDCHKSLDLALAPAFSERVNHMAKDMVLQLRYLGVIPQAGYVEYGFRIEDKDKRVRDVILTIDDALFAESHLMLQEAPDLCYQKVLTDLVNENGPHITGRMAITASDILQYRDSHPNAKSHSRAARKHPH